MKIKSALLDQMGLPAFPTLSIRPGHASGISSECGMELRDYFATRAMVCVFASPNLEAQLEIHGWSYVADIAYQIADAMLEERVSDD